MDIEDIAHALSLLCRFNGHCQQFYSVAEHSVHVSREVSADFALSGLLHDAAEAYLGDVPSPLKDYLNDFKQFEQNMEIAVGKRFGVNWRGFGGDEVKRADVQLLVDERTELMCTEPEPWPANAPSPKDVGRIECWAPELAKANFLARFKELTE